MSCCGYDLPESVLYYVLCVDFQDPSQIPNWQPQAILNAKEKASWLESCCLCQVNLETHLPESPIPSILRGVTYKEVKMESDGFKRWIIVNGITKPIVLFRINGVQEPG